MDERRSLYFYLFILNPQNKTKKNFVNSQLGVYLRAVFDDPTRNGGYRVRLSL